MKKGICFLLLFFLGCHPPILPYTKLVKDQETITLELQNKIANWVDVKHGECMSKALLLDPKEDRFSDYNLCMAPTSTKTQAYDKVILESDRVMKGLVKDILETKPLPKLEDFDTKVRAQAEKLRSIGKEIGNGNS